MPVIVTVGVGCEGPPVGPELGLIDVTEGGGPTKTVKLLPALVLSTVMPMAFAGLAYVWPTVHSVSRGSSVFVEQVRSLCPQGKATEASWLVKRLRSQK